MHTPFSRAKKLAALAVLALPYLASAQTKPAQTKPEPPTIDAGTIISDFQTSPVSAARAYGSTVILLKGRVTKVDIRKGNGKTFADVLVTATTKIGNPTVIDLGFPESLLDQVSKLKTDDIIETKTAYTDFPAVGQDDVISEFIGTDLKVVGHGIANPVNESLIAWVRENNAFGPDAGIVGDMSKTINDLLDKNRNFYISFGPGLVKSGKATLVGAQDGFLYTLPLTDAQAADFKVQKMAAGIKATGASLAQPLEVTMTKFSIDNDAVWTSGKPLTGKITYESTRSLLHVPGDYAVRLVCADGGGIRSLYAYFVATPLPKESYPISFADAKEGLPPGPHVAIFQFVRVFNHTGETPTEQVLSVPTPMILQLKKP